MMVTRSGLCAICNRASASMHTCMLCGAIVCPSDFNQNVAVCANCAGKFREKRSFERQEPG